MIIDDLQLADHQLAMEQLFNSGHYSQLERQLTQNNAKFNELPVHQRLVAVYLLKFGGEYFVDHLWTLFYKRKPPSVEEYLSPAYLPDTMQILYPQWKSTITKLFQPDKAYYEWILGGSIGAGKTTAAIVGHMFNLIRVGLLLNPHATLGAAPNKGLILSLFTVTLPKARKALVEPFKALMVECSDIFEEVSDRKEWKAGFPSFANSTKIPFYDDTNELVMPNRISVMLGSQTSHALSFDMFGAFLDEAEFRDQGGDIDKSFEVYTNLKERVDSRFLDSRFKFVTLVSSARYSTGIIAQYTNSISADSPHSIYSAHPIWEIKQFASYAQGHFWVMRGTSSHPSRILEPWEAEQHEAGTFVVPEGCAMLRVPLSYKDKFDFRIEEAIRNLAGMQTIGEDHPFTETQHIEDKNLVPEFKLVAQLGAGIPLASMLPKDLFVMTPDGKRFKRYGSVARYVHLDLATANVAGITVMHKELHKDRTMYVTDFTCEVISPTRIDLNAIGDLVIQLKTDYGVYFRVVSADQFQSDALRQRFETLNIADEVRLRSVDRDVGPYVEASRVVTTSQVKVGRCQNLRMQMEQVSIHPDKSAEKIKRGPAGKDQLDSWVGALTNAIEDIAHHPSAEYITTTVEEHAEQETAKIFEELKLI